MPDELARHKNRTMAVRSGRNLVETIDGVLGGPWVEDNSNPQEQKLLERVVDSGNMKQAWKQVKQNRGGKGIRPVKRVEIPKPGGGMRKLGIPTVVDRLIQQAICQILTPIFDPGFSKFSFGFRPGRSAHDAVRKVKEYQENGKQWVVDMDLKQFFDEVDHDVLMSRVGRKVKDKRLKRLINAYLKSGVIALDKELERRGHSFCRYCDDFNIYVTSEQAGERVMKSVTTFLQVSLKLKVNQKKSAVDRPWRRKFLGFSSHKLYGKIRTSVPKVTLARFRANRAPGAPGCIRCHRRGQGNPACGPHRGSLKVSRKKTDREKSIARQKGYEMGGSEFLSSVPRACRRNPGSQSA